MIDQEEPCFIEVSIDGSRENEAMCSAVCLPIKYIYLETTLSQRLPYLDFYWLVHIVMGSPTLPGDWCQLTGDCYFNEAMTV